VGISSLKTIIKKAKQLGLMQIDEEFLALLNYLKSLKLQHFLEIGTALGGAFYALSQISDGKGISIDLPGGTFGGISYEQMAQRNAKLKTYKKNSYFLADDSHNLNTFNRVKRILGKEKLDLCFIDGDHTYNGVLLDYLLYSPLVKPKGLIVFHDIKDTLIHRNVNCNVATLWNQLEGRKREFCDNKEQWGGIGILETA
jgi:predicted O-methyltransferase YrrM